MSDENKAILNRVLKEWPPRAICISSWLEEQGVSQPLSAKYLQSGWIERVGHGAFKRAGETIAWPSGLQAVQDQAKLHIHVGGKSALQLNGYAHYVPLGDNYPVYLFGTRNVQLPVWFKKYPWKVKINYIQTNLFESLTDHSLTTIEIDGVEIMISSPERAIFEEIYLVPKRETYDEAFQLMGSLSTLRPQVVQLLLEKCKSVKVKRVFMVMAEHYNYPWVKLIDLSKVYFGKGKRELIKNGYLEPNYQITIPKNYDSDVEV